MRIRSAGFALAVVASLLLSTPVGGQTKTRSTQRSPQKMTYETATTKSGRSVILKSDGTWAYADDSASDTTGPENLESVASSKTGTTRGFSSLRIETGVVMQSGDVVPLARTAFLLMDNDLATVLQRGGFRPSPNVSGMASFGYGLASGNILSTFVLSWRYETLGADKQTFPNAITLIRPHVRANTDTDFKGKAEIRGVAPGIYYVTGWYWLNGRGIVWSLKTQLKPGVNTVIIDQNNAALVGGG